MTFVSSLSQKEVLSHRSPKTRVTPSLAWHTPLSLPLVQESTPDLRLCWGSQLTLQPRGKGCRHVMYAFPLIRAWLEGMG